MFFFSFHHLSYCMGHRFQARQQTIETGQEGVFCGFMGNNIYPVRASSYGFGSFLSTQMGGRKIDPVQWVPATA